MVPEKITKQMALDSLRATIGNAKGYVYNPPGSGRNCTYASWDVDEEGEIRPVGPSCAVGQGLAHLGYTPEQLGELDGSSTQSISADMLGESCGVPLTWGAQQVYMAAQDAQDGGNSWGAALEAAELAYRVEGDEEPPYCDWCGERADECYGCDEEIGSDEPASE